MTDSVQTPARDDARVIALIAYGLFILAIMNGATAIAGVVLAYIKRDDARGTVWESHFTNMIRVFWLSVVVAAIFIGAVVFGVADLFATINTQPHIALLALVPALYLLGLGFFVWYLYRTVRGFILALDGKPY